MITIKVNDKEYKIKTSWHDVSYFEYAEMKNPYADELKALQKLARYTGIPQDTLYEMNLQQLEKIIDIVSFMDGDLIEYEEKEIPVQIAKESWYKFEKSKQIFEKEPNPYKAIIEVVKEYLNFDISDKPVTEVYCYADFFLLSSIALQSDIKG